MRCRVLSVGSFLPARVVTNDELAPLVRIRAERIEKLFDIQRRHWVRQHDAPEPREGQHCSDLGVEAVRRAIAEAGVDSQEVDTLVTVSTTPDFMSPSLDALVARKLGLRQVRTFDLRAACAGIFRAAALVQSLMEARRARLAVIVAAEALSPFFRFGPGVPDDHRLSTVLYGDGAGALVIRADSSDRFGISGLLVHTTGDEHAPGIFARGMLSSTPPTADRFAAMDYLGYHDFHSVLARGAALTWRAAEELFRQTSTSMEDYRLMLTHQATGKLQKIGEKYGIPPDKFPTNIQRVGNTISASILILLDDLVREGRVAAGDRLLLYTAESSTWSYASMGIVWG